MKTILIATDFSDAANNAAAYGVELAKTFNARAILFSACEQVPIPLSEVPVIITLEEMQVQVQRQLADEARILAARHDTPVTTCCKTGTARHAIMEAIREHQADLVITGMKKRGKQIRRIAGSTVTGLIRELQTPMIIVPEETKFIYISNIALATESDMSPDADTHILDALREIGERFHSNLYLVHVTENQCAENYEVLTNPFQVSRIVRTLDPKYKCIEGKDIPTALTKFTDNYKISLLAMLPHKHSLFERLFVKSATRAMAFECTVPLLILPDKSPNKNDEDDIQFN